MKYISRLFLALSLILLTVVSTSTIVHSDEDLPMVAGEVKKVKLKSGKVTIKHEEIPNLDMPGMTMVFRVEDAAMISELKKGDQVMFSVVEKDGKMFIVAIEATDK